MDVFNFYRCCGDGLRLRIVNLLWEGPLCVCHLTGILECDQVKMSKQLKYMKALGLVEGERHAQWMIYRLAEPTHGLLSSNLQWLRENSEESVQLALDLKERSLAISALVETSPGCADALLPQQSADVVC